MFDLTENAIEAIIFAMEDQEGSRRIEVESGEVVVPSPGETRELLPPPEWTSRDGYRLMEDFLKTVRNPSARHELVAALGRGRGVFKAFKEALVAYPEIERSFHDFKLKALRGVIRSWYEELREARGLERLGEEPEDTGELLASELGIELGQGRRQLQLALGLIAEATEVARELMPGFLAAREAERLRAELEASADWTCAFIPDGEGGAIALALSLREAAEGRSFGRVVFLYVMPDFRRSGMGRSLLEALQKAGAAEGQGLLVLDSAFLPASYAERLPAIGLRPYGSRGYFQP